MNKPPPLEKSVRELDPRIVLQFEKAKTALSHKNTEYPIQLCRAWIKHYPEVIEFRKLLREAQFNKYYPEHSFQKAGSNGLGILRKFFFTNEKDPLKAIQYCENILAQDPLDITANKILANITLKIGWVQTSIFAWQTLLTHPKRKPEHVIKLVEIFLNEKNTTVALTVCETFLRIFPNDPHLIEIRNKASISQSLQKVDEF